MLFAGDQLPDLDATKPHFCVDFAPFIWPLMVSLLRFLVYGTPSIDDAGMVHRSSIDDRPWFIAYFRYFLLQEVRSSHYLVVGQRRDQTPATSYSTYKGGFY